MNHLNIVSKIPTKGDCEDKLPEEILSRLRKDDRSTVDPAALLDAGMFLGIVPQNFQSFPRLAGWYRHKTLDALDRQYPGWRGCPNPSIDWQLPIAKPSSGRRAA